MPTGELKKRNNRHDKFYHAAKKDHFAARSVYKLQEIQNRTRLLRKGMRVLDLGCWPGSWLQYAATVVGPQGVLVGVDRYPLEIEIPVPGVRMVTGDVRELSREQILGDLSGFDIVLSDMAPDTSGIRMRDQAGSEELFSCALQWAEQLLVPSGNFVGKLFQGPSWNTLLSDCRKMFTKVQTIKPESTRKASIEQYVVCIGKK